MSFITKRERVFKEYDLFDLPARNEGKLKAYTSCTDARAWSHFCSDKTEHLVEIMKRNNDTCRTKYLPTDVIVDTLMVAKNAEIARLKLRIEEFERLLEAYDQLELTCDQKCEIDSAHAAIRAASKELDEMYLDLDLSTFTEAMDSDAFESSKSRGDECCIEKKTLKMENKSNQASVVCGCDVSTSANVQDPRIQEMEESIISKDAKLSAMQNTIAVMENDICEPYCVYAHINTALEKIFGALCQNDKYKRYLSLMTAGKDTQCLDIRGKILFKLLVLEKFSLALIAPCSQEATESTCDCECLRAEIVARLDFALPVETKPCLDNKRTQLVADIMQNEEMKELLDKNKDSSLEKHEDVQTEDMFEFDTYSIDKENLKRMKNLQENYDDLMSCYERLRHEKDSLQIKCCKYEDLENELDSLKSQLREYNVLWTEKEYYRSRSIDIDSLKEQYLMLTDEASNLETQLKVDSEIIHIKSITIEQLKSENIALEKKINEALILFEKEKNYLQCKLKEHECTIMCQDQQIKSLTVQIDRLLEQSQDKMEPEENTSHSLLVIDEIESLKEQVNNLKEALYFSKEEKQNLHSDFEDKLKVIKDLKMEIEDWKNNYHKLVQYHNRDEVNKLIAENRTLSQDVEEKTLAVENLVHVLNNKSQEIERLSEEIQERNNKEQMLYDQIQDLRGTYSLNMSVVEDDKQKTLDSLQLERQKNQELLEKVKDYSYVLDLNDVLTKSLQTKTNDYDEVTKKLKNTLDHNEDLKADLINKDKNNAILRQEVQELKEVNSFAIENISDLKNKQNEYKTSLELTKKKSQTLENRLLEFENLIQETNSLRELYNNAINEKEKLKIEVQTKIQEQEKAAKMLKLCKKGSEELIKKLDQSQILEKKISQTLNNKNEELLKTSQKVTTLENELLSLNNCHDELLLQNNILQNDFKNKTRDVNNLYENLEDKIKENEDLLDKIKILELNQKTSNKNLQSSQAENVFAQTTLSAIQRENAALIDKLKQYENLESEYKKLKLENESIQNGLSHQITLFKMTQKDNQNLNNQNRNLQEINEKLEKSLINTRNQLSSKSEINLIPYGDILEELGNMRKEKHQHHNKITDLLNRLDKAENIISNLSGDISNRDDKIAYLKIHINNLEDEIKKLHTNLADVIKAGESIQDNSFNLMDQSIKTMEDHQSREAHMKMNLEKLHDENCELVEQLSETKLTNKKWAKDKNKYLSQVVDLLSERKIVVTEIKQLELKYVGDSHLNPDQCRLEHIQSSLARIRKSMDAESSKNTSLEQTILKVQTSSQLLLTKADEAKQLVEKEKHKIIMEKEDAIKDRLRIENRIEELKNKFNTQINNDARIIKDLKANILNQKLLNEHTVSKLKEELEALRSSNLNSTSVLSNLQEKVRQLTDENEKYLKDNEKLNKDLDFENKEKENLKTKLEDLYNTPVRNVGLQVNMQNNYKNISLQTDALTDLDNKYSRRYSEPNLSENRNVDRIINETKTDNTHGHLLQTIKPVENKQILNSLPKQTLHLMDRVQMLPTEIKSTIDFVRKSYLTCKMQRLSFGPLEKYSISNINIPARTSQVESNNEIEGNISDTNLIDIYNKPTHSFSSKIVTIKTENSASKQGQLTPTKLSAFPRLDFSENVLNYSSNIDSGSQESADSNVFVIYTSDESNVDKTFDRKIPLTTVQRAEISRFFPNNQSNKINVHEKTQIKQHMQKNTYLSENELYLEDKSVKLKLNINLPRVNNARESSEPTSEKDKTSLNSDALDVFSFPSSFTKNNLDKNSETKNVKHETPSLSTLSNGENQYFETYSTELVSDEDKDFIQNQKSEQETQELPQNLDVRIKMIQNEKIDNHTHVDDILSLHKLSRVGADFCLIRSSSNLENTDMCGNNIITINQPTCFGVGSLLESVKLKNSPENLKPLGKVKSNDRFDFARTSIEKVMSKHGTQLISSSEDKTISRPSRSYSKISDETHSKSVVESSVIAKIESMFDCESKIKYLTKALESTERDYKKKLKTIKVQYDMNIKNILTEHNLGVKNIQGLHEETLQEVIKMHENEIENLRSMSIEANRKAEKLEKENQLLKSKVSSNTGLEEGPTRISSAKKRRKSRINSKLLTKTNVEAFNVKPKIKSNGPCTCSLDTNISDTIRNIFEQVDVDQRKMAELTYVKYIANKILNGNVEGLDAQELLFLHEKVCKMWKTKLMKEEALQKRIHSLERELMHKQSHAQKHIAELDRKVAEERLRLEEVREAVYGGPFSNSQDNDGQLMMSNTNTEGEKDLACNCNTGVCKIELKERRATEDFEPGASASGLKQKRIRTEANRAVLAKIDVMERREKKTYHDDPPTRLRRSHDRTINRHKKK